DRPRRRPAPTAPTSTPPQASLRPPLPQRKCFVSEVLAAFRNELRLASGSAPDWACGLRPPCFCRPDRPSRIRPGRGDPQEPVPSDSPRRHRYTRELAERSTKAVRALPVRGMGHTGVQVTGQRARYVEHKTKKALPARRTIL